MCEINTVWHKYPDEKPFQEHEVLVAFEDDTSDFGPPLVSTRVGWYLKENTWIVNNKVCPYRVLAWANFPEYHLPY